MLYGHRDIAQTLDHLGVTAENLREAARVIDGGGEPARPPAPAGV
jgi:hypothetical protein